MRHFLLVVFVCLFALVTHAQKYSFLTYSTEEGLPQTQVSSVTQDKYGYLWVGTIGGLSRFNGEDFVPYTTKDGLLNNRITSLDYFDDVLWIGHDGGISSIDGGEVQKFALTGDDKSRPITKILQFKGKLLACTNGGGIFILENKHLKPIELGGANLEDSTNRKWVRVASVYNNEIYLGTRAGVLRSSDLKKFELMEDIGKHSVSDILFSERELMVTTFDSLLIRKNLTSEQVQVSNPDHLTYLYGCYYDANQTLWLHGKEGVLRIDADGDVIYLNEKSGLPLNAISCIYQDVDKNIWLGSQGRGLFRFTGLRFKYFDQSTGYLSDLFMTGFQKENGDFYLGSFDKSIIHKKKNGAARYVDIGDPNLNIWASIKNVDGKDWFCTNLSLISIEGDNNVTVYKHETTQGLPGRKMVSFKRIDNRSMYIGGNEGVSLYRNGEFTKLGKLDKEAMGVVRDMEIVNGVLYCVSNHGLYVFKDNNFHQVPGTERVIQNIEVDHNSRIWIGSEEGFFYLENDQLVQVDLLKGDLRANTIYFLNYHEEKLYVGTNNGVFVVSDLEGPFKIKRYGLGDGIPDLETNLNSGFFDNDGNFWFGTSSALVRFHLDEKPNPASRPKLRLKSVLLNYAPFDYNLYADSLDENGMPVSLELPYNRNNLIFEFDGIALVNHSSLRYQFYLEGLSEEWSPLSPIPSVTFTNLPAGEYVLKVRAVDINGRHSEEHSIPLLIREAFYKTWWFLTLCALLLGGIIWLVFRLRLRRAQQINENKMLSYRARMIALEQKSLNASMNRHFIFNSLNSIQYFINTRDRLSANKYLTNFAKLIRKNLDSASLEDNSITLDDEISRIELYLSLESMRFKDRFEYTITTNDIDLEMYQIPAMLLQPFIENSIIHGILPNEEQKGHIEIIMEMKGGRLEILIRDNGIGVNQSMSRKPVDTGDHRSQGMEITSKRIELMQNFSNDEIELEGPNEIVGEDGSINGTYVLLKLRPHNLED